MMIEFVLALFAEQRQRPAGLTLAPGGLECSRGKPLAHLVHGRAGLSPAGAGDQPEGDLARRLGPLPRICPGTGR